MMQNTLSPEEMCRRLRPVFGRKIDALYLKYSLSTDRITKQQIEQAINALYHKNVNSTMLSEKILLEPPRQDIIKGDYDLGNVNYADKDLYQFGLRERDWVRHICISGMSGSGKTNFAFQILKQFVDKKKPFLVFDWKKSFRPLMRMDENIMCFTIGNPNVCNSFKININRPPKGVSPKEWLGILCDLITESFSASFGVHKMISETLHQAFREFKVYEGSDNYPTWRQIRDRLEEKADSLGRSKSRESEWITSALRIAHSLTFGDFADVVCEKEKPVVSMEDLLNKQTIIELNSLSSVEKKFFCEFVLTYIYKYKKVNEIQDSSFKNAILVDEAHNIFLKYKPNFVNESVTEVIYREIREYGTSLICLDQHISKLSDVVAGNSACNVAFQQILPQDIEAISSMMQLRDRKFYFSMLPVGTAVVKLAERHHQPFVLHTPLVELKSNYLTDEEVAERMKGMFEEKKETKLKGGCNLDKLREAVAEVSDIMARAGTNPKPADKEFGRVMAEVQAYKGPDYKSPKSQSTTNEQTKFLQFLQKFPQYGTAQIYKALGLSARKGNKLRTQLVDRGLVSVEEERSKNGWKKNLMLTEEARFILASHGVKYELA
jgi:hypothetical protein